MSSDIPAAPETTIPSAFEQARIPVNETDEDGKSEPAYQMLDFPDGIDHGMGVQSVLEDLGRDDGSVYHRIWRFWQDAVEDRENEPYVLYEDVHERLPWTHDDYPCHLVLTSKRWKVGTEANGEEITGSRRYEYSLRLMRYDVETGELETSSGSRLPISYQTWVRPQDEDLVYKSGDNLECPYGEGTQFQAQTTYASASEVVRRTQQIVTIAMHAMDAGRPRWTEYANAESYRIWKGEVHHRFKEEHMDVVVGTLREAERLLDTAGKPHEHAGTRQEAGRVEALVRSTAWDTLGFAQPDGLEVGCKIYRMSNWNHLSDRRLRQPKIEAYMTGRDHGEALPHVGEWSAIRAQFRQLITGILVRSGVGMDQLVEDDYYHPWDGDRVDVPIPTGWRAKIREVNDERERRIYRTTMSALSQSKWDILWTIAINKGASYDMLEDATGLARPTIREYVAELCDEDVLCRMTWPRIIDYVNAELRVLALEALQEVHPDEGMPDIKRRAKRRRRDRAEQQRERELEAERQAEADEHGRADRDDEPSSASAGAADWRDLAAVRASIDDVWYQHTEGALDDRDVRVRADRLPERLR